MTELGETKEVILNENEEYLGIGQLMAGWDKKKTGPKKASAEKEKKKGGTGGEQEVSGFRCQGGKENHVGDRVDLPRGRIS